MAIEFRTFPTEQQAGDALYNELRRSLGENPEYHADDDGTDLGGRTAISPHVVMLAGGSTPLKIYRRIAEEPPRHVHPATHLMLSDDRYVAAEDERSNYGHVRPLAHALGLPENRLVHVNPDLPLPEAVHDFGIHIAEVGRRQGIFSLAVLGIGGDGHTASLFTPDLVEDLTGVGSTAESSGPASAGGPTSTSSDRATPGGTAGSTNPAGGDAAPSDGDAGAGGDAAPSEAGAENTAASPSSTSSPDRAVGGGTLLTDDPARLALHTGEHGGLHRVSVGSAVLLSFRTLIFFATGHSKRDILYELSRRPEHYPAGRIMLQHPNATIWTDEAPRVR